MFCKIIYSKKLDLFQATCFIIYAECRYVECRGAFKKRQIYERAYPVKTPGIVKNGHKLKIIIKSYETFSSQLQVSNNCWPARNAHFTDIKF